MNIKKLAEVIKKSGLTRKTIAERAGITPITYDNILKGMDSKISTIENIARVLGVPVGTFFDNEGGVRISQTDGGGAAVSGDGNSIEAIPPRVLAMIEEKDRQIHRLLDLLEKK
ncbi:MAG: helix-turn-helix domain-containing protein [Muribaculaceae bacterium]|nr:helix-turn-helix domain-containing protein [Muribaculaceae bacterium]